MERVDDQQSLHVTILTLPTTLRSCSCTITTRIPRRGRSTRSRCHGPPRLYWRPSHSSRVHGTSRLPDTLTSSVAAISIVCDESDSTSLPPPIRTWYHGSSTRRSRRNEILFFALHYLLFLMLLLLGLTREFGDQVLEVDFCGDCLAV